MYPRTVGATLPRMTTDAEHGKNLLQFQAEHAVMQTKALQAIERDTHVIQAVLSVLAVLIIIGMIVWLIAVFTA